MNSYASPVSKPILLTLNYSLVHLMQKVWIRAELCLSLLIIYGHMTVSGSSVSLSLFTQLLLLVLRCLMSSCLCAYLCVVAVNSLHYESPFTTTYLHART